MKTILNQETLVCSYNPQSEKVVINVSNLTEQFAIISRDENGEELVKMVISSKRDFFKYPYGHKLDLVNIYILAQEDVDISFEIEELNEQE